MSLNKIINARKLVDFIENEVDLALIPCNICPYYNHIGALFTDIILQAGLNYKSVVSPRVNRVFLNYPSANTVSGFYQLIQINGLENIILWKNDIKLNRMMNLIYFSLENEVNTSLDLKIFLLDQNNRSSFLGINGVGNKTYDYLLKLMNVDTVAVDRHIFSFLEKAGIDPVDYAHSKSVVEYAADIMNISRRSIDYSIWTYMAYDNKIKSPQLLLDI